VQVNEARIAQCVLKAEKIYFMLEINEEFVQTLEMTASSLTENEKGLIMLTLDAYRHEPGTAVADSNMESEAEKTAYLVQEWVQHQLALSISQAVLPDSLVSLLSLDSTRIPLLLYGGNSDFSQGSYKELKKLLGSFFESDLILIPLLAKGWLILVPETLLTASIGEEKESVEDALTSICSGLYEMLANEWVGECHLTIHYPLLIPAVSLLEIIIDMQEIMRLGKILYPDVNIHLPWEMFLEKLLNALPNAEQMRFIAHVLKGSEPLKDMEMYSTLEHFFAQDCNVSETAKKLYIHRNTLLYRLDKFNQETGFDVRHFKDAVLVKVALLLYKATKK